MKNIVSILKIITLLLTFLITVIIGQSTVLVTKANPKFPGSDITIYSPQNNMNYTSDFHLLNFSIWVINDYNNGTRQAWYNLDGQGDTLVSMNCEDIGSVMGYPYSKFWGITDLPQLSFGEHYIKVSVKYDFGDFVLTDSNTVTFNVQNSTIPKTIPKPSIPEFTVKLLSPQTENTSTIQFTIKNQPFDKSLNYSLYYNIRYRVNSSNWKEVYRPDDAFPSQSKSNYTILEFSSSNEYEDYFLDTSTNPPWSFAIIAPNNSVLDVQAKAMIGYIHRVPNPNFTSQLDMYPYVFTGETSDWSTTQTITITTSLQTENTTPNQSTNLPNTSTENHINMYEIIVTLIVIIGITTTTATLLAYFKKHKRVHDT